MSVDQTNVLTVVYHYTKKLLITSAVKIRHTSILILKNGTKKIFLLGIIKYISKN